ncbi:DUF1036 domain-containing protein [uncultured Algimonas sp.]|uniref:DUF1036 domain-containing protein n=1 Tax=uncultured Algimonas sp. TaxID=1547920 RepID=UPI002606EAA6|nr:DUF1036 domain-containing protein [uncultured Algimonas sp.]
MREPLIRLLSGIGVALAAATFAAAQGNAETDGVSDITVVPPDPTLIGQTTEWRICNETSYVLRTASAFTRGAGMTAKGWNEILPGGCIALTTPVMGPRFLFAESIDAYQGGVREWKGTTPLCVDDVADFAAPATQDCRLANRTERDYFAVRPGEPVTTLVEPLDYGRERAVVAAQQRLLRDAGYAVSRVDGVAGRRTSRLLRTFRDDNGLAATVTGEPLMRALVDAAKRAQATVGLEICNQSSAPVWAAVATREDDAWRSRGWWRTAPNSCVEPLDISLIGTDAHFFALQESDGDTDLWLRTVATTPAQFCIAESRFDAPGNDMCVDRGYTVASFRPLPTEEGRARVRLTDADFAERRPGGLRR